MGKGVLKTRCVGGGKQSRFCLPAVPCNWKLKDVSRNAACHLVVADEREAGNAQPGVGTCSC